MNCSFCGKAQQDVKKLIAGQNGFICNECVAVCATMMADAADKATPTAGIAVSDDTGERPADQERWRALAAKLKKS